MLTLKASALLALALPLSAQAWDFRLEAPFPKGQNLPQALIAGTGELIHQQSLDTGSGWIATASHRIVRVGPVLKFEWNLEYSQLQTSGTAAQGPVQLGTRVRQRGLGAGVNAQFWVPFTGLAAELGAIERFQNYRMILGGTAQEDNFARPWLRVGLRYNLPFFAVNPYLAASYQQPITKNDPVHLDTAQDVAQYLAAQGTGQEIQRLWTFGVGITF